MLRPAGGATRPTGEGTTIMSGAPTRTARSALSHTYFTAASAASGSEAVRSRSSGKMPHSEVQESPYFSISASSRSASSV